MRPMNDRDIQLAEKIMEMIRDRRNSSTFIFNTNFTQIGKTNLLLLKGLLDIGEESGFFAVLDRPHQYMSYLLHMHDVSHENLYFIDSVTHMSGGEKQEDKNVNFIEGPFHIENLFESIQIGGNTAGNGFLSPKKVDFFLVDNVSTIINYNNLDKFEEFVSSYRNFIKEYPDMMGGVTIDKESNPELYDILEDHFDKMIDINELKKEVQA